MEFICSTYPKLLKKAYRCLAILVILIYFTFFLHINLLAKTKDFNYLLMTNQIYLLPKFWKIKN